jgi:folate-binding protein YgfZ
MDGTSQPPILASRLPARGFLRVGGAAARSFLQGLVTNDVDKVDPTTPIYAALLTPQGKFLHDFLIVQIGDSLVLDLGADRVQDLLRRLTMYRLRAAVDLDDVTDALRVVGIFGGVVEGFSTKLPGTVVHDPRSATLGYRLYSEADPQAEIEALGGRFVEFEHYEALRVAAGVPDGSRDIPVEKAFPLEYGFDALGAVSYDKGCYVGQELTARTHNRGKVKKALYRLRFEDEPPAAGTAILAGATEVGEILTSADSFALAHVRIDATEKKQTLSAADLSIVECVKAPIKPAD